MAKHRGMGSVRQRGSSWVIDYYFNGHRVRRKLNVLSQREAIEELKRVQSEIHQRVHLPREDKLRWPELAEMITTEYQLKQRHSLETMQGRVRHLKGFFEHYRAVDMQPDAVQRYQRQRIAEKASPATVNRETSCLHHMLVLAQRLNRLSRVPRFERLAGERVREGFLSFADFEGILKQLQAPWRRHFIEFAFLTGWRVGRVRQLEWKQIFLNDSPAWIKTGSEIGSTKQTGCDLPLTGRLLEIIHERQQHRRLDCPFVFHHNGQPVGDLRKSWGRACKLAGFPRILLHDFRRSIARNLTSLGTPMPVIMARCGWKTTSTFLRYRINSFSDQLGANDALDGARAQAQEADAPHVSPLSHEGN
jgi:integrase